MRKMIFGLVAATTLAASGPALAEEPLELGHEAMTTVTAGSAYGGFNLDVYKNVHINQFKNMDIRAHLVSLPRVHGNLAEAEAGARAFGHNSFTQTTTITDSVQDRMSQSFSESIAASDRGARFYKRRY